MAQPIEIKQNQQSKFWADKIAREVISSKKYLPYWVDDMKTPSGRIHVGSLRGVVVHGLIYQALLDQRVDAKFSYVFDDHDPMDEISVSLEKEKWGQYLGQPLFTVPSPDGKAVNYAEYFAEDFTGVFNKIGFYPKLIRASGLYIAGKMNKGVKSCLDNAQTIRNIYSELYNKKISSDWYPFQVVCPNCGKEATTKVTDWDGELITFTCDESAVKWTRGCSFSGKASPFSGNGKFVGKLPWKVEWAVKWQVIGVTIEGAGKDHMVDGGSHDVAKLVSERVLKYPVPYPFSYEFFLLGGKKMSSSKGLGSSAKEVSEILPPYLLRFLFVRTDYRQAIEFNPVGTLTIPDLFDEYDRCRQAYISDADEVLSRIFVLSQIDKVPPKEKVFLPRFRDVANYVQLANVNLYKKFEEMKGKRLTFEEIKILEERAKLAHLWVSKYAPEEYRVQMKEILPDQVNFLTTEQKMFLKGVLELIKKETGPDELQLGLYRLSKDTGIDTKESFKAIYESFIGKEHGPKAAWFLLQYPKEQVIKRLEEASK